MNIAVIIKVCGRKESEKYLVGVNYYGNGANHIDHGISCADIDCYHQYR